MRVAHRIRQPQHTMPTSSRLRRVAKWVGTVLSAIILVAWALTVPTISDRQLLIRRTDSLGSYALVDGTFEWAHFSSTSRSTSPVWNLTWGPCIGLLGTRVPYGIGLPSIDSVPAAIVIVLPLWVPLIFVAGPTAFLWYRERRRRFPSGHCQLCGYNLKGNQSGVCPECGSLIVRASTKGPP
jgi:hypothetical protein